MKDASSTWLSVLGAEACGLGRDVLSRAGERLRPIELVVRDPGARVGTDKLPPDKGAWFEPGVYSAAEAVDIINHDAIGVRAEVLGDGRVHVEET